MNSNELWRNRFAIFVQELQKYLKYIFNGHLVFVLIIGFGGLAYYYSEWVKTLDRSFPAAIIIAAIIAIVLTKSPIYTLLKEPDMFFLLPIEKKLTPYFKKSINLSLIMQSYILLMLLVAAMPLYVAVEKGHFIDFFWIFIALLVVKYFNIRIKWAILRYQETATHIIDSVVRYFVNFVLLYMILSKSNLLLAAIVFIVLIFLWLYFERAVKDKLLKWEMLISLESKRMLSFYRFANLFTDVPNLKEKVSRRKWLDPILTLIAYKHENTYLYLYLRTFLRSSDFLGLFIRLTVIGLFVLFSLTSLLPQIIGAGLFVYLTGFQLILLRKQHDNLIWHDLYPISENQKNKAIQQLLFSILMIQIIIFALVGWIVSSFQSFLGILVVGVIIIVLLRAYYQKLIKKLADKWD
ncbi:MULTISPECIES: ABC transporter permease [Bacillus]|uniref:ABC transporter permease n=1 Tax=Bacillus TaxID=1386 RepID=UPI00030700C3|nr:MULTISPECIES: ABC transporter permease [Bacillus]